MRSRTPQPRRSPRAVVIAVVLAVVGAIVAPLAPIGAATPAQADVATGGSGAHRGLIDWLTWGTHGTEIARGDTSVSTRTIGSSTLVTTCTVTERSGRIFAYRSGSWSGDALDNLYNVGGADGSNTLVYGISNRAASQGNDGTLTFQVGCQARLDGVSVPIRGLVIADAEQNNYADGQTESISARPGTGTAATWRIIDRARGCTGTSTLAILATDNTLTLRSDGRQCAAAPGGPIAVAYMEGATSGTFSLTTQGGAASAIAIGTVLEGDFGDAPQSYGSAGGIFTGAWSGGTLTRSTTTNVSVSSFALAQHQPGAMRLGATVDADPGHQFSAGTADDLTGVNDEDAVFRYAGGETDALDLAAVPGVTQSVLVSCTSPQAVPAHVQGWIDFNRNGSFDVATEASTVGTCSAGNAPLSWTIPADVKPATTASPTFLRLRIAAATEALSPIGMATTGEVEDHPVAVQAPALAVTKTSSIGDGSLSAAGQALRYTVTLSNTGRQPLASPTLVDELAAVLGNGATFVRASAGLAGGTAVTVPLVGTRLQWNGTTALAPGQSAVMTVELSVTASGRGLTLVNSATGSGTSGSLRLSATASVSNPVAVQLEVQKRWIVDGVTYADGAQPPGLSAAATATGPGAGGASGMTWNVARDGYARGTTATVAETTTIAAGLSCTLVSATARVGSAAATPMPATVQLNAATTVVTITNTVTCDSRITLRNTVDFGSADPSAWTLTATGPTGGVTGASGATGAVRAGDQYALGQSGGDPAYVASAWTCRTTTGEAVVVSNGSFRMPLGKHVECSVVQTTARLTMLKHIDATVPGTIRASDFTLVATPASGSSLPERQTVGAGSAAAVGAAGTNTFEIRPGLGYTLSERSRLAYLGLELQHYPGGMPAGGVLLESNWRAVTSSTITVEPGTHAVYRFVNSPVPVLTLPLTGGVGSDAYLIGGAALLLAALAFVLYRSRKRPRGGLA